MSKLYVFGIGGTGSRVLKALTMLLATGVQCNSTIVPIIIDPDQDAADLTRATEFMKLYARIHEKNSEPDNSGDMFFKTEIMQVIGEYRLNINNTQNVKFKEFIGYNSLDEANKALCAALFSKKNLESDMKVGFKGNPNLGSVVLNQFSDSTAFDSIANSFAQGDRIFIISSIFGGTGASGFPLLLKNLLTNSNIKNHALINNAKIGAITVLPYFSLQSDENSEIDSSTFISKTKSALGYYEKNISNNNSLDVLYYIGDNVTNTLENHEGGSGQQNPAHLIELASALAVLDFEKSVLPDVRQTIHKEFGIRSDNTVVNFATLSSITNAIVKKRLIQMYLTIKYFDNAIKEEIKYQPWARVRKIDKAFLNKEYFKNIIEFCKGFKEWIIEMGMTQRGFNPFNIKKMTLDVFETVNAETPNGSRFTSYALIDHYLNGEINDKQPNEEQFLRLFFNATNQAVTAKFNN
ncbi:MAG: hypothetical protein J6U21_11775 [Bacteroidales bacterium]|nr:hypothetical protein [Bacteroidales bacterium]